MDSRIKTIADHYSYEAQSRQCMEECAELIQAINKLWRARRAKSSEKSIVAENNLVDEIADVQIMLWQMQYLLEIPECEVKREINSKLERQMRRIKEENA